MMKKRALLSGWVVGLLLAARCLAAATGSPGLAALDYAFRFASAIESFPKDQAKAQERVVRDYLELGALDAARDRAERIGTWRRGTALADVAAHLARAGRLEEAREALAEAERVYERAESWPRGRVAAHLAMAWAALGDLEQCRKFGGGLAKEEWIKALVATVELHGTRGDYATALELLKPLEETQDFELTWGRTEGYLRLARLPQLNEEQRRETLAAARRSAERTKGDRRVEMITAVAVAYHERGETETARKVIAALEESLQMASLPPHQQAGLGCELALAWARVGQDSRARALLSRSLEHVERFQPIEQPILLAAMAGVYARLGDAAEAGRLYERALAVAEGLSNSRPRALAVVDVCRSLATRKFPVDDALRARLDRILAGLGSPW